MTTQQKLAILLLLLALAITAFAQDRPLSDTEQQQWAQFAAREKSATDALTQAANDLLNTPTGEASIIVHSHYQTAWLVLRLAQMERAAWLAKLQAKHGCADCAVSEDGKALVPPKAAR